MILAPLVTALARWCGPWQTLYSDSKWLETGVTSVHIGANVIGGGIAIAVDRDTLRMLHRQTPVDIDALDQLGRSHRPVIIGLVLLFLSGVALTAADVNTFAKSPVFLVKMILVILLCVNGWQIVRTEQQLRTRLIAPEPTHVAPNTGALWWRLRAAALSSIVLWILTVVVGTALLNV